MSNQPPAPTALKPEEYNKVARVETDFRIIKKLEDPRFGQVAIIEAGDSNRKLMVKEKVFNSKAGNYDVVYSDAPRPHIGGGVYVDYAVNFITPSTGAYRIGFSASMVSEAFNTSGARAIKVGNISGNNQTFTAYSDGTVPMRWIEG